MSDDNPLTRIRSGFFRTLLGSATHNDIQQLTTAIEALAEQIQQGHNMTADLSRNIGLLNVEVRALSDKLEKKASQSSLDELKRDQKKDFETLVSKLEIIIQNTHRGPAPT